MAQIIYEMREFTDRNSGIKTQYPYIAIKGTGNDASDYEVQLKSLVQSEKMALKMIHDFETGKTEIQSRKATSSEQDLFKEQNDPDNLIDLDN